MSMFSLRVLASMFDQKDKVVKEIRGDHRLLSNPASLPSSAALRGVPPLEEFIGTPPMDVPLEIGFLAQTA